MVSATLQGADLSRAVLKAGEHVWLDEVGRFADGVAVKQVGEETFRICRALVDDIILVDTDEICAAIKAVFEDTRSIMEPAGALGVAGAIAWAARNPDAQDKTLVAVLSGANMNFKRLGFVSARAEIGTEREVWLCAEIPERPGAFLALSQAMGGRDVTELNYRYADADAAHVFVAASVRSRGEGDTPVSSIQAAGFQCWDLSDNDVAKTHLKHMVGGRSPSVTHERVFQFTFPERPGALRRFLETLPETLNISLFHYRNQGSDVARVLVGIQVPPVAEDCLADFLVDLAYPYTEETDNPAVGFLLLSRLRSRESKAASSSAESTPGPTHGGPLGMHRQDLGSAARRSEVRAAVTAAARLSRRRGQRQRRRQTAARRPSGCRARPQ